MFFVLRTRLILSLLLIILSFRPINGQISVSYPYSVSDTALCVWNGSGYIPLTIKGINLGVAIPGTFPSELNVSKQQYTEWFDLMRSAGFNTIRLYTLHYPQFYAALADYNIAHLQQPLLLLQGVWLEEELTGYDYDLNYLKSTFEKEITDNVNCVHGKSLIEHRLGKAYGTYSVDVSAWTLGYIIGREVYPEEVLHTNDLYPQKSKYTGDYLSIEGVRATEVFVVSMMDYLLKYEQSIYSTQRPVSFSSWPTLDPLSHPDEDNPMEDIVSVDLSAIDFTKAPAGVFISYHAYPYYPDFISRDLLYQGFTDYLGQNSYLGYLTHLKRHYQNMPLIIAEFGVPSSWGVAHYAQSGMNHGGFSEQEQGELNVRLFSDLLQAGCGGGVMFAWIDEWFKRTWVTDQMDFLSDRRILWHNASAAEQNFGLIGFANSDSKWRDWFNSGNDGLVNNIKVDADFAYFKMRLQTKEELPVEDTLWIALDTYDALLGESVLLNGKSVKNRAEFLLMVTGDLAELYVTEAYDLYGIWHGVSDSKQLYHSIATNGAPWKIVRWKNNQPDNEIQFIGRMGVSRLGMPVYSNDAVIITSSYIDVKLPWTLINVVDPSTFLVMNDNRMTTGRELTVSDGFAVSVFYNGKECSPSGRYLWEGWNHALNATAYMKQSYYVVQAQLSQFGGGLVAFADGYQTEMETPLVVNNQFGVLKNDRNFDGDDFIPVVSESPRNGQLFLSLDGAFSYYPVQGFAGVDSFSYRLLTDRHQSSTVTVSIDVAGSPKGSGYVSVYPNPSKGVVFIESKSVIDCVDVFNISGVLIHNQPVNSRYSKLDLSALNKGTYFVKIHSGEETIVRKLMLIQ